MCVSSRVPSAPVNGGKEMTYRGKCAHRVARVATLFFEALEETPLSDDAAWHHLQCEVKVALDKPRVSGICDFGVLARTDTQNEVYRLVPL